MRAVVSVLTRVWNAWKAVGRFMGNMVGRVFLMAFYLTIALPFGIGVALFGDPLDIKTRKTAAWVERTAPEATVESGYNQF